MEKFTKFKKFKIKNKIKIWIFLIIFIKRLKKMKKPKS